VITSSKAAIMTPLLFDPGSKWEYGTNIDWVGQVVEGITGKRLGEVFAERIFKPLSMTNTTFEIDDTVRSKLAGMHARNADGSLTPMDFELPSNPEVHMGGHGLYSTVGDYMRFIRMWLNDGAGPHGRVLKPETVKMAEQNQLGDLKVTALPGVIKSLSNDAEFFPGLSKSWAFTFMVNDEKAPTGRPAGALGWAGLANLFYWIDRRNGFGGFWATQILPFADVASFTGYMRFETAFYDSLNQLKAA
jgi:methyl acetate hydrolase